MTYNKYFGSNCPKSICQAPDSWVKIYSNILDVHQIFLWILDKMSILLVKIGSRVLELQLGKSFGPNWPKTSFWALDPQLMACSDIQVKHFIQLKILHKVRPCLQKLDKRFCTYGFVSFLVSIGPRLVLRSQTPKPYFFVT